MLKKKKGKKQKSRINFSDLINLQKVGKSAFGETDENTTLLRSRGWWSFDNKSSGMLFPGPVEHGRTMQVLSWAGHVGHRRMTCFGGFSPGLTRASWRVNRTHRVWTLGKMGCALAFCGPGQMTHIVAGRASSFLARRELTCRWKRQVHCPIWIMKWRILTEKRNPTVSCGFFFCFLFFFLLFRTCRDNTQRCVLGVVYFIGRGFTPQFLFFSCQRMSGPN